MSLLDILTFIVEREKNAKQAHTEFIIPFRVKVKYEVNQQVQYQDRFVKRDLFRTLYNYPYDQANQEDISTLWYALSVLNRYPIEDESLEKLFFYLCSLGYPAELFKRCGIKEYLSSDVIPLVPYQFIKDHLQKEEKKIGSYSSHTFYLFYMIGKMVAFVITLHHRSVYVYIERSESEFHIQGQEIIKELLPHIVFP